MNPKRPPGKEPKSTKDSGGGSPSAANKALITRNLRLAYDEVVSEAVPDRMMELLQQIESKDKGA